MSARRGARDARGERGIGVAESLAAVVILGMAVLASAGLLRAHRIGTRAQEQLRAAEAVASEMAEVRAAEPASLPRAPGSWISGIDAASGLDGARGQLLAEPYRGTDLLRVTVELEWNGGGGRRRTLRRETLVETKR